MERPEHNEVRLPVLNQLLKLGWSRGQIVCPSPDSSDGEWRVPHPASEHSKREAGRPYKGYPVDLVIFDSDETAGQPAHVKAIFEFKAPLKSEGREQLKTYLLNEPAARYGYWTNGTDSTSVYRLADGTFLEKSGAPLPAPSDNLVMAGREPLTFEDLATPTDKGLRGAFGRILNHIAATDSVSTRPEQRLNEMANLLILKIESDKAGAAHPGRPLFFQIRETPEETYRAMNEYYRETRKTRCELFLDEDPEEIALAADSVQMAVAELQPLKLKEVSPRALSTAFQVFRTNNLKIGDGQYFTPDRVIADAMPLLDVTDEDKVIDPAGGTGGFVFSAYIHVSALAGGDLGRQADLRTWAHDKLFMVDRDSINVKLARALMVGVGDGSTHIYVGDSIREQKWSAEFPALKQECMRNESYTVVATNPPFGKELRVSAADARLGSFSICRHARNGKASSEYCSTEIGIVFVERAWRLLKPGGRLGIVLPETYFFSSSYQWFREWVAEHFVLRGVMNIPMEAFQGFCRAKTNFYVLQKKGVAAMTTHVPEWFAEGEAWVSNAPTIGINKDGVELYRVDEEGRRLDELDDGAALDVAALLRGEDGPTSRYVPLNQAGDLGFLGVPKYSDHAGNDGIRAYLAGRHPDFAVATIGELVDRGLIEVRTGHGSPASDVRFGDVPYVKVSDLRAGLVNVNRANMVPRAVAERFWRGVGSGLEPFDVVTPSRACKNIGEPCVLLPEQVGSVLTKEIIVFRPGQAACFDSFYLAWALDLEAVRAQWDRVVFMQTNREDVGDRYREIEIPVPPDAGAALRASAHCREYYTALARIRSAFTKARNFDQDI